RFKERAWARLDWAAAVLGAVCVYAAMIKGGGIYIFPLDIRLMGAWIPLLLAIVVAVPVGLRRRDPVGALILALAGCSVIVAVGHAVSPGPVVALAVVLLPAAGACEPRGAAAPR